MIGSSYDCNKTPDGDYIVTLYDFKSFFGKVTDLIFKHITPVKVPYEDLDYVNAKDNDDGSITVSTITKYNSIEHIYVDIDDSISHSVRTYIMFQKSCNLSNRSRFWKSKFDIEFEISIKDGWMTKLKEVN